MLGVSVMVGVKVWVGDGVSEGVIVRVGRGVRVMVGVAVSVTVGELGGVGVTSRADSLGRAVALPGTGVGDAVALTVGNTKGVTEAGGKVSSAMRRGPPGSVVVQALTTNSKPISSLHGCTIHRDSCATNVFRNLRG